MKLFSLALTLSFAGQIGLADPPEVVDITADRSGDTWRFSVTLRHPDTGWDHYADGWRVELMDGTVVGERPLAHPHVNEQPFTRSLGGIRIPENVGSVLVRARCNVDGWSDQATAFDLPR